MAWNIVYFIVSIVMAVLGIWNLAKKRFIFLALACFIWFLLVLFSFIIKLDFINYQLLPGATISQLVTYLIIPVFIILSFFSRRSN